MDEYQLEQRRRKFLYLLASSLQSFQRSIIIRRRRTQQRAARRQAMMRSLFLQMMMKFEARCLELIPLSTLLKLPESNDTSNKNMFEPNEQQNDGYYQLAMNSFSDAQWLEAFRMSRETFHWLCDQIRDAVQPQPHGTGLPLELRVAVALYAFVSGEDYRVIALLFNVSRTSVCKFMHRFAEDLLQKLGSCLLSMPKNDDEYLDIRTNFQNVTGMPPLVVGVLGVCEIPLSLVLPEELDDNGVQEVSRDTTSNSIILQAIIDDRLLFRKIQVQSHTPSLLLDSANEVAELKLVVVGERALPCFVITPAFYPMRPWLQHSFTEPTAVHQIKFNAGVNNVLTIKDKALTRLFSRWKILQRKSDLETHTMERITSACCALHNLLEENEEMYMEHWEDRIDTNRWNLVRFSSNYAKNRDSKEAPEIRKYIARSLKKFKNN